MPGPEVGQDTAEAGRGDVDQRRCGFIAVVGAPNAGKSTLVNRIVGSKVTIVSHKVQTTRVPVRGITIVGESQLVFVDTPGIFQPKRRLDRAMVEAAWGGAKEADIVALIVDAQKGIDDDVERIVRALKDFTGPKILLLNKVDRLDDKSALLSLTKNLTEAVDFEEVFMLSALKGDGVEAFKAALSKRVPEGPWHYPEDELSDLPMRMLAAELTREKIYERLHQELPYAITVETSQWKTLRDKSVRIEQTIFVARDSQKKIVLGKGGQTIKAISSETRNELTDILGTPVHLFLFVKVRQGWEGDPERYREMGLNFPKN